MKLILKAFCQKYGGIFDGLSDDACFTDYIDEFDYVKGFPRCVSGGFMRFEYDKKNESLYVITEYETTRKLTKEEEEMLIDYTQGQWSDGIGEGFEQQEFAGKISPYAHYPKDEIIYNPSPWHHGQKVTITYEGTNYNNCRICGINLLEGMARSNDYLAMNAMPKEIQDKYADTIQQPICHGCMKEAPDEYHKEFERRFNGKK